MFELIALFLMFPKRGPGASQVGSEWKAELGLLSLVNTVCPIRSARGLLQAVVMEGHCVA